MRLSLDFLLLLRHVNEMVLSLMCVIFVYPLILLTPPSRTPGAKPNHSAAIDPRAGALLRNHSCPHSPFLSFRDPILPGCAHDPPSTPRFLHLRPIQQSSGCCITKTGVGNCYTTTQSTCGGGGRGGRGGPGGRGGGRGPAAAAARGADYF